MPNTYNRETERTRLRGKVIRALPEEQDWNRLDFIDLTLSTFTCYLREKSKTGVCVCVFVFLYLWGQVNENVLFYICSYEDILQVKVCVKYGFKFK